VTEAVQVAFVTYVVPALILLLLEFRRRRIAVGLKREQGAVTGRVSDLELGQRFRDEIWERWQHVNAENTALRRRIAALEKRVDLITEIVVRHGLRNELPEWTEGGGTP
jgi:hypothetical protein